MTRNTIILVVILVAAFFLVPKEAWLYTGVGLLLGWNVLEQPAWVKLYFDKAVAWLRGLVS